MSVGSTRDRIKEALQICSKCLSMSCSLHVEISQVATKWHSLLGVRVTTSRVVGLRGGELFSLWFLQVYDTTWLVASLQIPAADWYEGGLEGCDPCQSLDAMSAGCLRLGLSGTGLMTASGHSHFTGESAL